jgi:hypothetical protein
MPPCAACWNHVQNHVRGRTGDNCCLRHAMGCQLWPLTEQRYCRCCSHRCRRTKRRHTRELVSQYDSRMDGILIRSDKTKAWSCSGACCGAVTVGGRDAADVGRCAQLSCTELWCNRCGASSPRSLQVHWSAYGNMALCACCWLRRCMQRSCK